MKKIMLFLAVLFLSASATSAFAKDICVQGGGGSAGLTFKFDKVVLKKGKTSLLAGRVNQGANNVPMHGAVTLDADGVTTRIVVVAYQLTGGWNSLAFTQNMVGDNAFNATGFFDNFPLATAIGGDGAATWTNINCSTVVPAFPTRAPVGPAAGTQE